MNPPSPHLDLGYAKVDLHREQRCGFPEVIFCEGKTCEAVLAIVRHLHEAGQHCLATRVSDAQAALLAEHFPHAEQDRIGRTFWLPSSNSPPFQGGAGGVSNAPPLTPPSQGGELQGRVSIVTAGTADLPVAHEALATAKALGCQTELIADVGVAGLHRLLAHLDRLTTADAVVVIAGMEGALPSVVGGLVACPVVAVPTSVGYGAAFGGLAALLGMLNSCAANVTVVNIDSGFKGGYVAGLIARRAAQRAR
jgi:NCAIR mutase (PurE)-related protein